MLRVFDLGVRVLGVGFDLRLSGWRLGFSGFMLLRV